MVRIHSGLNAHHVKETYLLMSDVKRYKAFAVGRE